MLWAVKVASTKSLTPYELEASERTYYGLINSEVRTGPSRSYDNLVLSLTGRPGDDNHSAETQRMVDSSSGSGSGAQTSEVSDVIAL